MFLRSNAATIRRIALPVDALDGTELGLAAMERAQSLTQRYIRVRPLCAFISISALFHAPDSREISCVLDNKILWTMSGRKPEHCKNSGGAAE